MKSAFAGVFTLTGENGHIKFSEENTITIDTTKKTISGKISFQEMDESINIPEQSINCNTNGVCAWTQGFENKMIGTIKPTILLNTNTLSISGNFSSLMGAFPLESISLTNNDPSIENINNLTTEVTELRLLKGKNDKIYELEKIFHNKTEQRETAVGNIFKNMDFSLMGLYNLKLIEKNIDDHSVSREWEFKNIIVKPGNPSNNLAS